MADLPDDLHRPTRPPASVLDQLQQLAPDSQDELFAEHLEQKLEPWGEGHWDLSLSEIVALIPGLRSHPISLDAVIDLALSCLYARGLKREAAQAALFDDSPDLTDAIHAHIALRSLLTSSRPGDFIDAATHAQELPRPFGPPSHGGQLRYQLVEFLGRGSEGAVFRAFDRQISADGRPLEVAVKTLHKPSGDVVERVSCEAARAMRLRHVSLAALLDWGYADSEAYLVYEFVAGESLFEWRRRHDSVSGATAAVLVRDIAEAVQAAHNAGVVHRDIKPNNIIIDTEGQPHITDFGLAEALGPDHSGVPGGSLGFAAPEQLRGGAGGADAAVDVYGIGGILLWLMTDRFPNGKDVRQVHRQMLISAVAPQVDPNVRNGRDRVLLQLAQKALSLRAEDRPQSAAVLANDLNRWLALEPVLPFERGLLPRTRLGVRRAPVSSALLACVLLLIIASSLILWQLERQSHEADIESLKATARAEARRLEDAKAITQELANMAKRYMISTEDPSWIPMFSALESLSNQDVLGMAGVEEDILQFRIDLVRDMLDESERHGTRDTVEMAMWEAALVFWLIHADRPGQALTLARINEARMASLLPANDPWVKLAVALRCIAEVGSGGTGPQQGSARDWLLQNQDRIPPRVAALLPPAQVSTADE